MFVPEIAQILGVYDEAFQKWKNERYKTQTTLRANFFVGKLYEETRIQSTTRSC